MVYSTTVIVWLVLFIGCILVSYIKGENLYDITIGQIFIAICITFTPVVNTYLICFAVVGGFLGLIICGFICLCECEKPLFVKNKNMINRKNIVNEIIRTRD